MYGSLDISVSGMVAQRMRLDVIASNIANRDAILDPQGRLNPYRRRIAVFSPGDPTAKTPGGRELGVQVSQILFDEAPFRKVYDPTNPYARPSGSPDAGYVDYPNVDLATEGVNAIEAVRAYEANVAAAEANKAMVAQALRLLA